MCFHWENRWYNNRIIVSGQFINAKPLTDLIEHRQTKKKKSCPWISLLQMLKKLYVTPDLYWVPHTCSKGDPPPCSEGFHRARRRTPCRYVATVPLAILLQNVPLLSQLAGFIPSKPIRAYRGLQKEGGKMSVSIKKEGGGDAKQDSV